MLRQFYRKQLRLLLSKSNHTSYKSFFLENENEPMQVFWWSYTSDPEEVLFCTYGKTRCPYKSAWLTTRYMIKNKLATADDIPELYQYMASVSKLCVKRSTPQ